jgi:hypothetical protein
MGTRDVGGTVGDERRRCRQTAVGRKHVWDWELGVRSHFIYIYSHIYIGIGFEESFIYILSFISISKPLKPSNGRNTSGRIVPAQKSCGAPESQPRHDTISMFVPALAL